MVAQIKKTGFVELRVLSTAGIPVDALSSDVNSERSFVDVLQSTSSVEAKAVGVRVLFSSLLDLFPVPSCYKTRSNGEGMRSAVDCYALESTPRPLAAAAVSVRLKRKGNFGIIGLLRNLWRIQSKLDRVLDGLALKPKRRSKRLGFLGLSRGTGGRESRYILEAGSDHFSAPDASLGLDPSVGLSSIFSPSVIEAVVEPPTRSPLGSPSKTDSLPEPSQVWQIDLVSTPVSPMVVYVPLAVVSEADFPAATEEAQAQTDRISSPVNGLIKRGLLGSKVISLSSIVSLGLVAIVQL